MVQRWSNQNERTRQALEWHCNEIWEETRGSDVCSRLVDSMRHRLQAVIEAVFLFHSVSVKFPAGSEVNTLSEKFEDTI